MILATLRRLAAAALAGLMAGVASGAFLLCLGWVTDVRIENPRLILLLPLAGVAIAAAYRTFGREVAGGNRLTASEIAAPHAPVQLRLAPMAFTTTLATHLFGGSAGREGTALQMSVGLADGVMGRLDRGHADRADERRSLLIAALAGGFGSVFGVPFAGVVFAMEVAPTSVRHRISALPGTVVASFLGHAVVTWMGVDHVHQPDLHSGSPGVVAKVAVAGLAFGLVARLFVKTTAAVRGMWASMERPPEVYAVLGGSVVVVATLALRTDAYNGLSLPLIEQSFSLVPVATFAFLVKLLMTSMTIGSGYQGGEVTPLFVIGATLGATLTRVVDGPPQLLAGVGMMAVFGAASNAPLACIVMGIELFGPNATLALAVGCLAARVASGRRHIYEALPPRGVSPVGTPV